MVSMPLFGLLVVMNAAVSQQSTLEVISHVMCTESGTESTCKSKPKVVCPGPSNRPCLVHCDGTDSCQDATISCNEDADCLVHCNGANACDGDTKLKCSKEPHFCGYYFEDSFSSNYIDKEEQILNCDKKSPSSSEPRGELSEGLVYCGGESKDVRGDGSRPFEQIACKLIKSNDNTCSNGNFCFKPSAGECKKSDEKHGKTSCNSRKAWHDGKFHVWCPNGNTPPTCECDHGTVDASNCIVAMQLCEIASCDPKTEYNPTTRICEPQRQECVCENGTAVQGNDCTGLTESACVENSCYAGNYFDATKRLCRACTPGCRNCSGPGVSECTDHILPSNAEAPSKTSSLIITAFNHSKSNVRMKEGGHDLMLGVSATGSGVERLVDAGDYDINLKCECNYKSSLGWHSIFLNDENCITHNVSLKCCHEGSLDNEALSWAESHGMRLASPLNLFNKEPNTRNVSITCHLIHKKKTLSSSGHSWRTLVSGTLDVAIVNVVRPVFGSVSMGSSGIHHDLALASDQDLSWQVLSLGEKHPLGIWTSGEIPLKIHAHPMIAKTSGNIVFSVGMKAYAFPIGDYQDPKMLQEIALTVDVAESTGGSRFGTVAKILLPSFEAACGRGDSTLAANTNECSFGLRLENSQSQYGEGGIFSCPKSSTNGICFDGNDQAEKAFSASRDNGNIGGFWAIKYVAACVDPTYLPAGHENCSIQETAAQCAFGARDDCRPCMVGAQCPGGYNAFGFQGYYTVDPRSGDVRECDMPSDERCLGWDFTLGRSVCGGELIPINSSEPAKHCYYGHMCSQCCSGYFAAPDKVCERCPEKGDEYDALLSALWPFLCILLAVCLLMLFLIFRLETIRNAKTPTKDGDNRWSVTLRQTKEFGIWVLLSAQVMASATSAPSTNLPEWIIQMYSSIAFFNLDTDYVVHPSCIIGGDPYITMRIVLGGALGITLFQLKLFLLGVCLRRSKPHRIKLLLKKQHTNTSTEWTRHFDVNSGCYFYEHNVSGETKWDVDGDSGTYDRDSGIDADVVASENTNGSLEWTRHFDVNSGCYFYEHNISGETKWDLDEDSEAHDKDSGTTTRVNPQTSAGLKSRSAWQSKLMSHLTRLQGKLFVVMSCLIPVVSKNMLHVFHCIPEEGSFPNVTNDTSIMIMHSAPTRTVCWEGEHVSLFGLSVLVLMFFIIGYPAASYCYLRKIVKDSRASERRLQRWEHFIGDDYSPIFFWFRHVYWLLHFLILVVYEFTQRGGTRCAVIILLLSSYCFMLFRFRPFGELDQWKLYARLQLIVLSCAIALLDMVKWLEVKDGTNVGAYGSTVFAYIVFATSITLIIMLPITFFAINYGIFPCTRKLFDRCGHIQKDTGIDRLDIELPHPESSETFSEQDEMWDRYLDDTGAWYLHHRKSGEVKWEVNNPMGNSDQASILALAGKSKNSAFMGWVEVVGDFSKNSNSSTAYVHIATGKIQYSKPEDWVKHKCQQIEEHAAKANSLT